MKNISKERENELALLKRTLVLKSINFAGRLCATCSRFAPCLWPFLRCITYNCIAQRLRFILRPVLTDGTVLPPVVFAAPVLCALAALITLWKIEEEKLVVRFASINIMYP